VDGCGGNMNAESGAFNSPGYPYINYDDYLSCTWHIEVPSGYAVLLTINELTTEECCDYLIVFDSNTKQNELTR